MTKLFSCLFVLMIFVSCSHMESGHYVKTKSGWEFRQSSKGVLYAKAGRKLAQETYISYSNDEESDRSAYGGSFDPSEFEGKFLWPVPSSRRITSPYGERDGRPHEGIDIAAPLGSHILAIDDGLVVYSGKDYSGYGNLTVIAHDGGFFSIYAHAIRNFTIKHQKVHKGEVIALVGSTGRSTGPHLHFEMRKNSIPYNPEKLVRR